MEILNSREVATLFWVALFAIFVLWRTETRQSALHVVRAFFQRQIITVVVLLFGYLILTVWLLQSVGLWDASQIKVTVLWALFAGGASLFRTASESRSTEPQFFRSWVSDNLKIVAVVEFIATSHTFPFVVEIVLIPILAIITTMVTIAEHKPEQQPVARILNALLATFGAFVVIYTVYMIASDFGGFANARTVKDFYTPPLLSLLVIPFLYGLHAYASYEQAFLRLGFTFKDDKLRVYAKRKAIFSFGLDFETLRRWTRNAAIENPMDREEIRRLIREVKRARKQEANPPIVAPEDGWSPFLACGFLVDEDLKTGDYHRAHDEWYASSPYLEIGDGILPDNIAYYVEGDENTAKRLKLVLNVNNPSNAITSEERFVALAYTLIAGAFDSIDIDDVIDRIFSDENTVTMDNGRSISLSRQDWQGGIKGGYEKRFLIEQISA